MSDTEMAIGTSVAGESVDQRLRTRIAVVFEPGGTGGAALAHAAALAALPAYKLTVVAIAPQATGPRCCGPSPEAYNCAVRDDVAQDLHKATARLGSVAAEITVKLLIEGSDLRLEEWVAQGGFDIVLLPGRRRVMRSRGHPAARPLRRSTDADVRVVGAARRHTTPGAPSDLHSPSQGRAAVLATYPEARNVV
jgi:hypothetical protein